MYSIFKANSKAKIKEIGSCLKTSKNVVSDTTQRTLPSPNSCEFPEGLRFASGRVSKWARLLFEGKKIDKQGNWIGGNVSWPSLSSAEKEYLRSKLEGVLPVLKQVQSLSLDKDSGKIESFYLIGSYVFHILFGVPRLNETPSYIERLFEALGIDFIPPSDFQKKYQTEPIDCDLRGRLITEKIISEQSFANFYRKVFKLVDPESYEQNGRRANPVDSGVDRFGSIPIPGTICEVIVYLLLKVPCVFARDALCIPLQALIDDSSEESIIPISYLKNPGQVVIDHLLEQTKVAETKKESRQGHLNSIDHMSPCRLWSDLVKGRSPADQGLMDNLFEKLLATTFRRSISELELVNLKSLPSKLKNHKRFCQNKNQTTALSKECMIIRDLFERNLSIKEHVIKARSILSALDFPKDLKKISRSLFRTFRTLLQKNEGFLETLDHWLTKHHGEDHEMSFVYLFNIWGFLSDRLADKEFKMFSTGVAKWERFSAILNDQNDSLIASLAKLLLVHEIPYSVLCGVLHELCALIDTQKAGHRNGCRVERGNHGHETPVYKLTLNTKGHKEVTFHLLFDAQSNLKSVLSLQANQPELFALVEDALLPHLLKLFPLGSFWKRSREYRNFIKEFQLEETVKKSSDLLLSNPSSFLSYMGFLHWTASGVSEELFFRRLLIGLPKLALMTTNKEQISVLITFLAKGLKGKVLLAPLLDAFCDSKRTLGSMQKKLWFFLYTQSGRKIDLQSFVCNQMSSEGDYIELLGDVVLDVYTQKSLSNADKAILLEITRRLSAFLQVRSFASILDEKQTKKIQDCLQLLIKQFLLSHPSIVTTLLAEVVKEFSIPDNKALATLWLSGINSLISSNKAEKALIHYQREQELLRNFLANDQVLNSLIIHLVCSLKEVPERLLLVKHLNLPLYHSTCNALDKERLSAALAPFCGDDQEMTSLLTPKDHERLKKERLLEFLKKKDFVAAAKLIGKSPRKEDVSGYKRCLIGLLAEKELDVAQTFFLSVQRLLKPQLKTTLIIALVHKLLQTESSIDAKLLSSFFAILKQVDFKKDLKKAERNALVYSIKIFVEEECLFEDSRIAGHKAEIQDAIGSSISFVIDERDSYTFAQGLDAKALTCPKKKASALLYLSAIKHVIKNLEEIPIQKAISLYYSAQKRGLLDLTEVNSLRLQLFKSCVYKSVSLEFAFELMDGLLSPPQNCTINLEKNVLDAANKLLSTQLEGDALTLLSLWIAEDSRINQKALDLIDKSLDALFCKMQLCDFAKLLIDRKDLKGCCGERIKKVFWTLPPSHKTLFARTFFEELFLESSDPFKAVEEESFYSFFQEGIKNCKELRKRLLKTPELFRRFRNVKYSILLLHKIVCDSALLPRSEVTPVDKILTDIKEQPYDSSFEQKLGEIKIQWLVATFRSNTHKESRDKRLADFLAGMHDNETWNLCFLQLFDLLVMHRDPQSVEALLNLMSFQTVFKRLSDTKEIFKQINVIKACLHAAKEGGGLGLIISGKFAVLLIRLKLVEQSEGKQSEDLVAYAKLMATIFKEILRQTEEKEEIAYFFDRASLAAEMIFLASQLKPYLPQKFMSNEYSITWSYFTLCNYLSTLSDQPVDKDKLSQFIASSCRGFPGFFEHELYKDFCDVVVKTLMRLLDEGAGIPLFIKHLNGICRQFNGPQKQKKGSDFSVFLTRLTIAFSDRKTDALTDVVRGVLQTHINEAEKARFLTPKEAKGFSRKILSCNKKVAHRSITNQAKQKKKGFNLASVFLHDFSAGNLEKALSLIVTHERSLHKHRILKKVYEMLCCHINGIQGPNQLQRQLKLYSELNKVMFSSFKKEEYTGEEKALSWLVPYLRIHMKYALQDLLTSENTQIVCKTKNRMNITSFYSRNPDLVSFFQGINLEQLNHKVIILLYKMFESDIEQGFFDQFPKLNCQLMLQLAPHFATVYKMSLNQKEPAQCDLKLIISQVRINILKQNQDLKPVNLVEECWGQYFETEDRDPNYFVHLRDLILQNALEFADALEDLRKNLKERST